MQRLRDLLLSWAVVPAALLLRWYRERTYGGSWRGRWGRTTLRLKNMGVYPIVDHYHEPLFDHRKLGSSLRKDRDLPGIDLNVQGQQKLLRELACAQELLDMDLGRPREEEDELFYIGNPAYQAGDADFLYQFLRHTKPGKVVEIGSGFSTKLARQALQKNAAETGRRAGHICIEPYERPWLEKLDDIELRRERLEECTLQWAEELQAGDLLFVDSSHIIRPQGDVLKIYLEILPRLQPGVHIHVHDIFTPKDYLDAWVEDHVWMWNEQYLLEAMLTNTSRYEVVAALNFLRHHHYEMLGKVCPYLAAEHEPASLYMRVMG